LIGAGLFDVALDGVGARGGVGMFLVAGSGVGVHAVVSLFVVALLGVRAVAHPVAVHLLTT